MMRERVWIYQILFLGFIYTLIGLLTATFIKVLIDRFIPFSDQSLVIWSAFFLAFLFVIRALTGWIRAYFTISLNRRIGVRLGARFLSHVFNLPQRFFDARKRGDITARLHDCIYIQNAAIMVCGSLFIDVVMVFASWTYMYLLASKMAYLTLTFLPAVIITIIWPVRDIRKKQNQVMHDFSNMESACIDSLSGIEDIISFATNQSFAAFNRRKCTLFQNSVASLGITKARLNFFADFLTGIIPLAVLTYGALSVIRGEIQMGQMMAAYMLLAYIIPSITRSIEASVVLQGARVAGRRLLDIILQDQEDKEQGTRLSINEGLVLQEVSFGWTRTNHLIRDLTLSLKKGYITALYGQSGSGKTTIANLILRKYSIDSGKILIDSVNAQEANLGDYRKKIGIVPQFISVFTGNLLENILIGRNTITENEFSEFISEYQLDHFIGRFQQGLFTLVGEEARRLSGGERQMLGIIRALMNKPEILIIDEGLNSADHALHSFILNLLYKYSKRAAILINTHNLDMLSYADEVYYLNNGRADKMDKTAAEQAIRRIQIINGTGNPDSNYTHE